MVRKSSVSSDRNRIASTPTPASNPVAIVEALESRQMLSVTIFESNGLTAGSGPHDITRGLDGNYYFTETNASQIGKVEPVNGVVIEYAVKAGTGAPSGITTAPDGNIWVAQSDGIGIFSPRRQRFTSRIALGEAVGDIIVGPDLEIWFTEPDSNRIGRIFTDSLKTQFLTVPTAASGLDSLTPDKGGSIWFTEGDANRVGHIIFRANRFKVVDFAVPTANSSPAGIVQGADGNMWFAEKQAGKIGVIDVGSGQVVEHALPNAAAGPLNLTLGQDKNIYFTEALIGNIASIDTFGNVTETAVPAGFSSGPTSIFAGPGRTLWFTEDAANQVAEAFY